MPEKLWAFCNIRLWNKVLCILIFSLQFFSIIVFGCISSSGWFFMQNLGQEVCVLNMDSSACHFSTMVGIVAFLASIGFLVGEWYDSHFFLFHSLIILINLVKLLRDIFYFLNFGVLASIGFLFSEWYTIFFLSFSTNLVKLLRDTF